MRPSYLHSIVMEIRRAIGIRLADVSGWMLSDAACHGLDELSGESLSRVARAVGVVYVLFDGARMDDGLIRELVRCKTGYCSTTSRTEHHYIGCGRVTRTKSDGPPINSGGGLS